MISALVSLALLALASQQERPQKNAVDGMVRRLGNVRPQTPAQRAIQERRNAAMIACRRAYVGQDYLPQPAIWKVTDADTSLYLFGTLHSLPLNFETGAAPSSTGSSRRLGCW